MSAREKEKIDAEIPVQEEKCCGCGGCAIVCPVDAISLKPNAKGFLKAYVSDACLHCGKCSTFCRKKESTVPIEAKDVKEVFFSYSIDDKIRVRSSSGGIASMLAIQAIEDGYTVIGAAYDYKVHMVRHICIQDKKDIDKIIGSKYLGSDTTESFRQIAKLDKVLFIGTPCQIKAVRTAFPNKEDLILVDFKCFGTASYHLWKKELEYLEKIDNSGIKALNMRSKNKNWLRWGISVSFHSGKKYFKDKMTDPFGICFSPWGSVSKLCLDCQYLKNATYADIRLQDAWNLMSYASKQDIKKGCSQVNIYTETGLKLWNKVVDKTYSVKVDRAIAYYESTRVPQRPELEALIHNDSLTIEQVVKEYRKHISFGNRIYMAIGSLAENWTWAYLKLRAVYKWMTKIGKGRKITSGSGSPKEDATDVVPANLDVNKCSGGGTELSRNKDGYLVRDVCEEACTDCGKCTKVCSVSNPPRRLRVDDSFVVYPKSMEQAYDSASGGFAWQLGRVAIKNGYKVIGAVWDFSGEKITVKGAVAENETELKLQRKSKYVQADFREAFRKIPDYDKVMVFGTPCQIAGLRNLYGEREGLVLVDMDCMGPASQKLLDKYVAYLNGKNHSGIKEIFMRDKEKDWMNYGTRVVFQDGTVYFQDKYKDPFCQLFHLAHSIHEACDGCIYANHSAADIRMGDAWDYLSDIPKKAWKYGASLVSIQNARGNEWLEKLSDEMAMKKVSRKVPEVMKHPADERILASIRDDGQTIEDAVKIYRDKPVQWNFMNAISTMLSRNLYVYYICKKIIRKLEDGIGWITKVEKRKKTMSGSGSPKEVATDVVPANLDANKCSGGGQNYLEIRTVILSVIYVRMHVPTVGSARRSVA